MAETVAERLEVLRGILRDCDRGAALLEPNDYTASRVEMEILAVMEVQAQASLLIAEQLERIANSMRPVDWQE